MIAGTVSGVLGLALLLAGGFWTGVLLVTVGVALIAGSDWEVSQ